MLEFNCKIPKVKAFNLVESDLIYSNSNSEMYLNKDFITSNNSVPGFIINGQLIYATEVDYETKVIDSETNNIKNIGNISFYYSSYLEKKIIAKKYLFINQRIKKLGNILYDFKNFQEIKPMKSTENKQILIQWNHKIYLVRENSVVECVDLATEKIEWEYDIQPEGHTIIDYNFEERTTIWKTGEFHHFLDIYKEIFWFVTSSGKIIGLSANTGSLLFKLDMPNKYPDVLVKSLEYARTTRKYWALSAQMSKEEGKIIGIRDKYYFEIDLEKTIPFYNVEVIPADVPTAIAPLQEPFTNTHIFYANTTQGWIAALNRTTLDTEWKLKLYERRQGFVRQMGYTNNKLYVLYGVGQNEANLHVFRRTD